MSPPRRAEGDSCSAASSNRRAAFPDAITKPDPRAASAKGVDADRLVIGPAGQDPCRCLGCRATAEAKFEGAGSYRNVMFPAGQEELRFRMSDRLTGLPTLSFPKIWRFLNSFPSKSRD